MTTRVYAEEFYTRRIRHARVLSSAGQAFAAHGQVVDAIACAWGSDLAVAQAVLWERIVVGSRTPVQRYHQAGEAVTRALARRLEEDEDYPDTSAEHLILGARKRMLRAFDTRVSRAIEVRLSSVAYLSARTAPSDEQVAASVSRRLLGLPASVFVAGKREDAARAMAQAADLRAAGDSGAAIRLAYDADSWTLAAYLVESAIAVGDDALLTVTERWELVNAELESLDALPTGFEAAVVTLRSTMAKALVDADAQRWRMTLIAV